jgi:PhnB protein
LIGDRYSIRRGSSAKGKAVTHDLNPAGAPRPAGYATVAPWLISTDTAAEIEFLHKVFGATEKPGSRIMNGDKINHVEIDLAGTAVMLFDGADSWRTPGHMRIYVHDVDATVAAAKALDAQLVTSPTDMAFGDRIARFRDPQGHLWWVHQHVEDVPVDEMMIRFGQPAYIRASEYVGQSLIDHMSQIHDT